MTASSGGQGNTNVGKSRDEQIREKLVPHIQNAASLEKQVLEALEGHLKELDDHRDLFSDFQQQVRMHIDQTKQHRSRMEDRLKAYGADPSAIKDVGTSLLGNIMGTLAGARPDTVSRIVRDEYVSEHMEVAGYMLLITTARAFGEEETARAGEQNLRDEVQMQDWLLRNMPSICLRDLQRQGYDVSGVMGGAQFAQGVQGVQDTGGYTTTG